jgi:hypothetical protein
MATVTELCDKNSLLSEDRVRRQVIRVKAKEAARYGG